MAGRKFGSTGFESLTWAMNSYVPALISRRFARSRIAIFSTGNIYGLTPAGQGGSIETDTPRPVGEYAMSCLARERVFEYFSRTAGTPTVILRLNYAVEMRYGILCDLCPPRRGRRGDRLDDGVFQRDLARRRERDGACLSRARHVATLDSQPRWSARSSASGSVAGTSAGCSIER